MANENTHGFFIPEGLKMPIFFAPSGAGKSSIVAGLISRIPRLSLSISDATRERRPNEIDGKDYYFRSVEEFKKLIELNAFIEYEEVYENKFYGTRHREIIRLHSEGKVPIFDIDVKGAKNLITKYPKNFFAILVKADLQVISERLKGRGTETKESFEERIIKAESEIKEGEEFAGYTLYNNGNLENTIKKASSLVKKIVLLSNSVIN